jgi:hypothetical protein
MVGHLEQYGCHVQPPQKLIAILVALAVFAVACRSEAVIGAAETNTNRSEEQTPAGSPAPAALPGD